MADSGSAPSRISKPGAVAVLGIARAPSERPRSAASRSPSCFADLAKREPGGGEIRRQFDRLLQQVGGGGQVAAQLQVAGEIEAAVGHQIAGGKKQAGRHGFQYGCAGQARA